MLGQDWLSLFRKEFLFPFLTHTYTHTHTHSQFIWQSWENPEKSGQLKSEIPTYPCHSTSSLTERKCILGFIEIINNTMPAAVFQKSDVSSAEYMFSSWAKLIENIQNEIVRFYWKQPTKKIYVPFVAMLHVFLIIYCQHIYLLVINPLCGPRKIRSQKPQLGIWT